MLRHISLVALLMLCPLGVASGDLQPGKTLEFQEEDHTVRIVHAELEQTDTTLTVHYQVANDSREDIWLCDRVVPWGFETYLDEDEQTLVIRRRFDALWNDPKGAWPPFVSFGAYRRLRSGESRKGSYLLSLPVHYRSGFTVRGLRRTSDPMHADRLAVEIGFYTENMFDILLQAYGEAAEAPENSERERSGYYRRLFYFAMVDEHEICADRDEVVSFPPIWHLHEDKEFAQMGQVVRATIDDCHIPYIGRPLDDQPTPDTPSLHTCTRVEITYEPSMLEFFFPSVSQRSLLSPAECDYLRSLKTTVIEDQASLESLACEIARGQFGGILTEGGVAHVVGRHGAQRETLLSVYTHGVVETESERYFQGKFAKEGLRTATAQIRPYEFRYQCSENLKDLWRRLRLCRFVQDKPLRDETIDRAGMRPSPTQWCDGLVRTYEHRIAPQRSFIMKPYRCPSAGEGRCHYAMNPNCEPNSPLDTVLLFETKAGWNQHGGPEVFTFDNHDPKGGCVLLNDGTVKFIRTEDELHALRWK